MGAPESPTIFSCCIARVGAALLEDSQTAILDPSMEHIQFIFCKASSNALVTQYLCCCTLGRLTSSSYIISIECEGLHGHFACLISTSLSMRRCSNMAHF